MLIYSKDLKSLLIRSVIETQATIDFCSLYLFVNLKANLKSQTKISVYRED